MQGAGLGLRRAMLSDLEEFGGDLEGVIDFIEVAPENWIDVGGRFGRQFCSYAERFQLVCHGLSLSLGSPSALDIDLLRKIKDFLKDHRASYYSEHLSYCSDRGHLYDLMPIPFTIEAVEYVAHRIRCTQDFLERRIAVENVSYYVAPGPEMSELEFINAVIDQADCDLLLDVNNIYVNSVNFGYDAQSFLQGLPSDRVAYIHVAGHHIEAPDLIVDSHGSDVIDSVWSLLENAYEYFGVMPTLLERDFNLPPIESLFRELEKIRGLQERVDGGG